MSTAAGRAAPSAQAGADGVSRRDIAALVYNYLRSNGFAKVRPRAAALVARPSPPRVPTTSFKKLRSARSRPARPDARPDVPTLPPPDPSPAPVPHIAQAAKQFRTDADPLLAPFRNRVPTGVVGLEHIVGEYVAARARDAARRAAMEANPLARRMYEQLDDYAMTAAGIAPPAHARTYPGPPTRRHHRSDDDAFPAAAAARRVRGPRPILPAPTREERERMAAAAAAAASARAHAAAGAGPPRAPVHPNPNPNPNPNSPRRRKPTTAPPRVTTDEPPMGSLVDDVLPEEGGGWRPYELPRELGDARVQERLAEYIVGVVRGGGPDAGSPGGWGAGSGGTGGSGGFGGVGGVGGVDGASSSPGAARAGAAERGVHLTDRDVEELTSQLWDDAELGRLLAPLLGPAGGGERRAVFGGGTPGGNAGTASVGPSPIGARGRGEGAGTGGGNGRVGVEGDAFEDPPATATGATRVVRVGSRRRKGSAPAKSRARGTGGANLPPELRGVDLDNLLDGIEY